MAAPPTNNNFTFSAPQYWNSDWTLEQRMPTVGDADGDGYADLLSLRPDGNGVIDIFRTSQLGKTTEIVPAMREFGKDRIAAACGQFDGKTGDDLVGVLADGSVIMAFGMRYGTTTYKQKEVVAKLSVTEMPKPPVQTLDGDFDGDGRRDILLAGGDGRLLLLRNLVDKGNVSHARFGPTRIQGGLAPGFRELAAGNVTRDGKARLFWIDAQQRLVRSVLQVLPGSTSTKVAGASFRLATPVAVRKTRSGEKVVVGRFLGRPDADVLVGQNLLPSGDGTHPILLPNLPTPEVAKEDEHWFVADFDNNGKEDLLRVRNSHEKFRERDNYIHYASDAGDDRKGFISTAQDGLLDDWKTGKVKPGGLDLKLLGCQVGRRDVIVEIGHFDNVTDERLRSEMQIVTRKFAELPIENPDGSRGIAIHFLFHDAVPYSESARIYTDFDRNYTPPAHRGVTHYFWADARGPNVAQIMGNNGHFNGTAPRFLHEFGHNLGLLHEGHWQLSFCALFPSLMNYAYDGTSFHIDDIHYSEGKLAGVTLDERHLSERLPFPIDKVSFLSSSPYFFGIKPGATPNETLVDWNWNGIFGETDVAADINYKPGTGIGAAHAVDTARTAPALIAHGTENDASLLVIYGSFPQAEKPGISLSATQPGTLLVRRWIGKDVDTEGSKWSEPITVDATGVTGEASVCYREGMTWIAYPTPDGVRIRALWLEKDRVQVSAQTVTVPDTAGVIPTLVTVGNRIALLLWRSGQKPVELRLLTRLERERSPTVGPATPLRLFSAGPVGAVAGADEPEHPTLWISGIEQNDASHREWMRLQRFAVTADDRVLPRASEWEGGVHGGLYSANRSVLLWERATGFEKDGRLFAVAGGTFSSQAPWSKHYLSMQIADKEKSTDGALGGGWMTRQYNRGDVFSRSAPGACFFRGDIVVAQRIWEGNSPNDDQLRILFHGRGIEAGEMGDFDDVGFIRDVGLRRSLWSAAH
jgi:hypothetical protein